MDPPTPREIRRRLLRWFDAHGRDLPWRRTRDPYRILVAEVLLQRTRVVSGRPYYERFLDRFPDLPSLARATEAEVLLAWEGLGFYRRARNLHAAARAIAERHGGRVPRTARALAELPGIGPYTAGAVASIAFGEPVAAVDGNATRVIARLFLVEDDVTRRSGRNRIARLAADLVSASRPGAFNQALMELGATLCTPTSPACPRCPLEGPCLVRHKGLPESLPRRPRPRAPQVLSVSFALVESGGRVLLVRRPRNGLLGGLWALPGGQVRSGEVPRDLAETVRNQTGLEVEVGEPIESLERVFSHRRWSGTIVRCRATGTAVSSEARWVTPVEAKSLPIAPFARRWLGGPPAPGSRGPSDGRRR